MIIRTTALLAKKLRVEPIPNLDLNPNILEDWCANYFRLGNVHLVLFMDSKTLLPLVIEATPYKDLFTRFHFELKIYLKSLGYEDVSKTIECSLEFGKCHDRTLSGIMIKFVNSLKLDYENGDLHPSDVRRMTMELSDEIIGSRYRASPLDLLKAEVDLHKD